ncbi:MAG: 2-hydroxyacid dehydrogenase [Roseinatronobacter sp.]
MTKLKVATIGDHFITSKVLAHAAQTAVQAELEIMPLDLEWPDVPFFGLDGPAGTEIKEYSGSPDAITALLSEADALLTHLAPVTRAVLGTAPKLKFIGVTRGGPVNINIQAAKDRGIKVSNVPGRNASSVAEFTIGAILANLRKITAGHAGMSQGVWRGDLYRYDRTGDELADLCVGIVGYSHIGQRVVRLLKPFGCRILVCDPFVPLTLVDTLDGVEQVDIETMLKQADIVSLHARLTPDTTRMISEERITLMKSSAILINTARGELIDQNALREALVHGRLGGAALDTYLVEPPHPDDALLKLPNVTLTPHIAGASRRVATYAAQQIAEDFARFLNEEPLRNPCN